MALKGKMLLCGNKFGAEFFAIVSHEFRHISDFFTGKLVARHDGWIYNGRKITERRAWENRPFEKVAITYEKRAYKLAKGMRK
jgi:hypothetical protein